MKQNLNSETKRLFESNFMEAMSKIHWTVPPIIFIPLIIFFLYRSLFILNINPGECFLLFAGGILFWSFLEYLIHRFAFHFEAKSDYGKRLVFIFHGIHHDHPNDPLRLVMPPSVSLPLGTAFYLIFHFVFGSVYAEPLFAGLLSGYLAYDMTHFAVHHFMLKNKTMMKIKTHHMKHHYKDSTKGFGVSSPLWDKIFQTEYGD